MTGNAFDAAGTKVSTIGHFAATGAVCLSIEAKLLPVEALVVVFKSFSIRCGNNGIVVVLIIVVNLIIEEIVEAHHVCPLAETTVIRYKTGL